MLESSPNLGATSSPWVLLRFNANYCLYLERDAMGELVVADSGKTENTAPKSSHLLTKFDADGETMSVYCEIGLASVRDQEALSLDALQEAVDAEREALSERLKSALSAIREVLYRLPYLDLGENEYIFRFRTAKQRNTSVYIDAQSETLYQSHLCASIKAARRIKEKSSSEPALLDFGPVRYVIPSHFGFCLGVQNAIERAYEAVASHPQKRVFMLSELIHNPFVNADLIKRGLRYLQTDKGQPLTIKGEPAKGLQDPEALWNQLHSEDIVIIPAFGATNEDKTRLVQKGLAVREHDATCMLVEKVWKAARRYATEGYTVIIHGKSEHEETKATFSNSSYYGPALMIRNQQHAKALGNIILAKDSGRVERFRQLFKGLYSDGFDVERDLDRIAVVNQTTLLRNETLDIIEYFKDVMAQKYGADEAEQHIWSKGKGDTLCYATQVNQDALQKALEFPIDAALVVGGKNSSNTYQLYRVCHDALGERAHYIQSEGNLISSDTVRHYIFQTPSMSNQTETESIRKFHLEIDTPKKPRYVMLTGGASCPDGIIQQVINRINAFFPAGSLRSPEAVLADFKGQA
ncbi:MAG: 4-hydroxy-3-methylbut-2-enyl diphosphate reductase [Opitutia bacterium UBA7350]|nr:MAG: 4-hydroxy-3-methylbut-2-enyl diphosphate reductase [Opitutae bacterium UBA7350]